MLHLIKKLFKLKQKVENHPPENIGRLPRILLVDDARVNRYILQKYIEKAWLTEIEFDEASNGASAVKAYSKKKYDIIFMDIIMPNVDGITASKRILRDYPDAVIIGSTGQIETPVMKDCIKAGMKGCLRKPLDVEQIRGILEIYLPRAATID